jgi:hypothetical protein
MAAPAELRSTINIEDGAGPRGHSEVSCWVAMETLDGRRFLDSLKVSGNAQEAMQALVAWHRSKLVQSQRFAQYILCKRNFVGIGLLEVLLPSPDSHVSKLTKFSQELPCRPEDYANTFHETQFKYVVKDELLTTGFRRPTSLVDEPNYVRRLLDFQAKHETGGATSRGQFAVFVGQETDRKRMAQCFIICALLSCVAGIGVGIATGKIVNGAAVAGTILTLMNGVQAACVFACG